MKVLFVGGTGRTGSTLVDRLLGSAPGWFSGGELAFLWRYGLARGGLCSCGAPLVECPVWSIVLETAGQGQELDAERMIELRRRFWSLHLPLLVSSRVAQRRLDRLEEFPSVVERVYRSVLDVTGDKVLIDSSKDVHYSWILRERTDLDVYFLHLVRDPRAIGHSWTKRRLELGFDGTEHMARRNVSRASVYFNVSNSAAELLWSGSPTHYRLLRYEDLVEQPRETCARIAEFVGEDVDLSGVLDGRTFRPAARHTTWGNPNRFVDEATTIESDEQWRVKQPRWRSEVLRVLNAPLAHRYGYRSSVIVDPAPRLRPKMIGTEQEVLR
jgi:hypothetical protein